VTAPDCARVDDVLAESALGLLDGDERAEVLAHIATCPVCEQHLGALASAADALLVGGPEVEPPVGFEAAVIARLGEEPAREPSRPAAHRPRARVLLAAAAVLVVGLVVGLVAGSARWGGDRAEVATSLRTGDIVDDAGVTHGEVFAHPSDSWLLVLVGGEVAPGTYAVECAYGGSDHWYEAGTVEVDDDGEITVWATSVPVPLDDLTGVRLAGGSEALTATVTGG
jgi:hypothetical protein